MKKSIVDVIITILLVISLLFFFLGFLNDQFMLGINVNIFHFLGFLFLIPTFVITFIYLLRKKKLFSSSSLKYYKIGINIHDLDKVIMQNDFIKFDERSYLKKVNNNEIMVVSIFNDIIDNSYLNKIYDECNSKFLNVIKISSIVLIVRNNKGKNNLKNVGFRGDDKLNEIVCLIVIDDNSLCYKEENRINNYLKYSELKNCLFDILKIK